MQVKAAKDFANSPNGLKVDQVKKGAIIDVNDSAVDGMVDAKQIENPEGKDYSKQLKKSSTTKEDGDGGGKPVDKMNKAELVTYAADVLEVEIDTSLNKADFLAAVNEAIADAENDDA